MARWLWGGFSLFLKVQSVGTTAALKPPPVMPYCLTHLKEIKSLKKKGNPGLN